MTASQQMKVGWIGTGVMGSAMAAHILRAGHELFVYNRTPEKTSPLIEIGAVLCASPAEVAEKSDFVVTMVGYPADVEEVVLGQAGTLGAARPGSVLIDMTTSDPALAQRIAQLAGERGLEALDAPVSGGDVGARNASLVIMVGGNPEAYDRSLPLFRLMGKTIRHVGPPGAGQRTKLANQVAIAAGMVAFAESMLYARSSGLDLAQVIEILQSGAAASWSLGNYGPRALVGDFSPGFKVEHFIKDLRLAIDDARRHGLFMPGLALAEQLYVAARSLGLAQSGTHALLLALAHCSGVKWPQGPSGAA